MKDGIWAFALPFVILVINTCCMTLLDSALSSIFSTWVIAIPGFAGYRLILNMSHLLKSSRLGETTTTGVVDTVPLTYGFQTVDTSYEMNYLSETRSSNFETQI